MANSDGGATSVAIDVPVEIELRNGAVGSSSAQTSPVRKVSRQIGEGAV
jgi:hypothetical protein